MAQPEDSFFKEQEAELNAYADKRVLRFQRELEAARKEIQALIVSDAPEDASPASIRRLQSLLRQLDQISADLDRGIHEIGTTDETIGRMVQRQAGEALTVISGSKVTLDLEAINPRILALFSQNELEKVTSLAKDQIQAMRSVLFTKVGVQGQNPRQVAKELAGTEGMFTRPYGIIETIVRTETSTVYNHQHFESIKYANESLDLNLNKRVVEFIDDSRNHPISQAINGMVQKYNEPFVVPVAKVKAVASKLGKTSRSLDRSIFWEHIGSNYVGMNLPAHYRERGRIVPTEQAINI